MMIIVDPVEPLFVEFLGKIVSNEYKTQKFWEFIDLLKTTAIIYDQYITVSLQSGALIICVTFATS